MRTIRTLTALAAGLAAALIFAGPAAADTGHFHSAASTVDPAGALVVSFDERGLGTADVDYTLSADASAVYACINGGDQHPQAANKETVNAAVSAAGSFEPRNGRVVASLSAAAPSAGDFACPPGQDLVLASVAYTNVVLVDDTNAVSVTVADAARVFVELR